MVRPGTRLSRPASARAVARRTRSLQDFGYCLRDWMHELGRLSTRKQLRTAVWVRPETLAGRFPEGALADSFLAAQVEFLCNRAGIGSPRWVRDPRFVLEVPWFSIPGPAVRAHLLLDAPVEFRNRNLFTVPESPFKLRSGRPRVSEAQKREKARLRQQRRRGRLAARNKA